MKPDPLSDDYESVSCRSLNSSHRSRSSHSSDYEKSSETQRNDCRSRSQSFERRSDDFQQSRRSRADFRPPRGLPPRQRQRGVPDFKKNPDKWTCYTLGDVSEKDMSERSNTNAALAFLDERKKEREKQERLALGLPEEEEKFDVSVGACSQGAIQFKRSSKTQKKVDSAENGLEEKKSVCNNYEEDGLHEESNISYSTEKEMANEVSFKSKNKKKRNIRKRTEDDDISD